ncbi:MAG TPA: hypothetical protein VK745_23670 [Polyangiaceae bacterium]|nr:hypothetical protein [Polyangiaceae bacterium]
MRVFFGPEVGSACWSLPELELVRQSPVMAVYAVAWMLALRLEEVRGAIRIRV